MPSFLTGFATGFLQRAQEHRDTAEAERREMLQQAMARYHAAIQRNEQRLEQEVERRRVAAAGAAISGMPLSDAEGFAAAGARLSDFSNIRAQTSQAFGQPPASPPAPQDFASRVTRVENPGGNPAERNPSSTATGNGQFVEGTWLSLWNRGGREAAARIGLNVEGLDPNRPEDRDAILALRTNPALSQEMINVYRDQNRPTLQRALGRAPTDAELYMAHFLGAEGAQRFLTANPNTPADRVVSGAALANNRSVFVDPQTGRARTVGEVMSSVNQRFATPATASGTMTSVAAARTSSAENQTAPTPLLPPDPPEERSIASRMRDAFFGGDPMRGLSAEVRRRYGESRGMSPEELARLEAGPSREVPQITGSYTFTPRGAGSSNLSPTYFRDNDGYNRYVASGGSDVSGLRSPDEIIRIRENERSAATRARGTTPSTAQIGAQMNRFGRMAADAMGVDSAYENGRLILRSGTDEARQNATVLGQRAFQIWSNDFNYDATRMYEALTTAATELGRQNRNFRPIALDPVRRRFENGDYESLPVAPQQPNTDPARPNQSAPTPRDRAAEEQRQRQLTRDADEAHRRIRSASPSEQPRLLQELARTRPDIVAELERRRNAGGS